MTGKMLSGGDHAVLLETTHERAAQRRIQPWILAKRPNADDGIGWIVVDVEDWGKDDVNSQRTTPDRRDSALLVRKRAVACGGDAHFGGKNSRPAKVDRVRQEIAASCSIPGTELEVRSDDQRNIRQPLHRIELFGNLER